MEVREIYRGPLHGAEETYYHDVDVQEDGEGYIVTVGHKNGQSYGDMIIDVFDQSGGVLAKYTYETYIGYTRLSCVKCIGGGRVIVGGGFRNYTAAFIMEVDITDGSINWKREVNPDSLITSVNDGGVDVEDLSDVIEIELDKEARPIFMAISDAHKLDEQDPDGPGVFARVDNNGVEDWAISDEMEYGFGDLEPMEDSLGLLSSITGVSDSSYTSRQIFAEGNSKGFSGCESKFRLSMDIIESNWELKSRDEFNPFNLSYVKSNPDYDDYSQDPDDGCCWLPYYSPLPWLHPWESTYWPSDSAWFDAGSGYTNYDWIKLWTRNIWDGNIVSSNVTGSNQTFSVPYLTSGSTTYTGGKSTEMSRVEITVTDSNDCYGWDATIVHIAEDGIHNVPDYTASDNAHENEDYYYCRDTTTSPSRHIYAPDVSFLSHKNFQGTSPPTGPLNILNTGTYNHLFTLGTKLFGDSMTDGYNASGSPRPNLIHTDVYVDSCDCFYSPIGSIEEIEDNGRIYYSLSLRDLRIAKYSFALHMSATGNPDKTKLIKRRVMRNKSVGNSIDEEDFLLPTIDDRYLRYNSSYSGTLQKMYLDLWFTNSMTYPYDICYHERVSLSNVAVTRKSNPNSEGESYQQPSSIKPLPEIVVYPNPANDNITIIGLPASSEFGMVDMQGRTVVELSSSGNEDISNIKINKLDDGLYFLKIRLSDNRTFVKKVIKQ